MFMMRLPPRSPHPTSALSIPSNQTPSIFIDLRIPRTRPESLAFHRSLATLSTEELRLFARQHCFAGYSLAAQIERGSSVDDPLVVSRRKTHKLSGAAP
jgi:hypothetical protein